MNIQFARAVPALLSVCLMIGCGGGPDDLPNLGTVSGTVTLGGQPVADAQVVFQPESGRPSFGTTDAGGRYELAYTSANEGAVVGKHKVRISTYKEPETDDEGNEVGAVPETIPAKYNAESELLEDVAAGNNEINFELEEGEVIQPDEGSDDDDYDE